MFKASFFVIKILELYQGRREITFGKLYRDYLHMAGRLARLAVLNMRGSYIIILLLNSDTLSRLSQERMFGNGDDPRKLLPLQDNIFEENLVFLFY